MQIHHLLPLGLLAVTLAAGSSLSAMDMKYGAQAGLGFPTGDLNTLVNKKMGFTLGGFTLFDLQNGHAIRPRLDWAHFQASVSGSAQSLDIDGEEFSATGTISVKYDSVATGADYLYFFNGGTQEGFYLLAGLGLAYNRINVSASGTETMGGVTTANNLSDSASSLNGYGNLGVGYQITPNFGVEARYNATQYKDKNTETQAVNLGSAILAVSYRF